MEIPHTLEQTPTLKNDIVHFISLLLHAHKGISNTFWSMSNLSLQTKRNFFFSRTGTYLTKSMLSALKPLQTEKEKRKRKGFANKVTPVCMN